MASILQKFYEGRVVLLTGGTGFLGKVLLIKLLHSCPDIGAIILFLRKKHGKSCQERLLNILSSSVRAKCLSFDPSERLNFFMIVSGAEWEENNVIVFNTGIKEELRFLEE
jgi:fatty acyl-CoA reductase